MRKSNTKKKTRSVERRLPAESLISALASATVHAEQLRSLLARLDLQKMVLDQHAVVSECDAEGRFTYVNDALCRISGYSREELIGKTHAIINSDRQSDTFWDQMYAAVKAGGVWQSEVCNRHKDGSEFWLMQTIAAVRDDDGNLVAYVDVGADITETKRLQTEIVRRGRLAQLGQLTATVAHEIRNPLGAVKTAAFVLERRIKDHNEKCGACGGNQLDVANQMQRINNGISRCDRIISELLDFARNKNVAAKLLPLDQWLQATVEEEARNLPTTVEIVRELNIGETLVPFDPDQLRRAVINLLTNSCEAMVGKAGEVAPRQIRTPRVIVSSSIYERFAEISVTDNGPGISPENLAKVREPLFTTKSFGIGLGIPAIEKIVEGHGGSLNIDSSVGVGTIVTIRLPLELATGKAI